MDCITNDQPEKCSLWKLLHTKEVSSFKLNQIRSILRRVATAFQDPQYADGILTPERIQVVVKRNQRQQVISTKFSGVENLPLDSCQHFRWYMAPETLLGLETTEKSHVWSLACIVAEMFLGSPFYTANSDFEMIRNITKTHGRFPDHLLNAGSKTKDFYFKTLKKQWLLRTPKEDRNRILKDVSCVSADDFRKHQQKSGICSETKQMKLEQFIDLFKRMQLLDPANRIALHQVLQHPFVAGNTDLPRSSVGNVTSFTGQQNLSSSEKIKEKDTPCQSGKERKLPTVWIMGSEYYINGAQKTANECYGENFGLDSKINWIGKVNMRWRDVFDHFKSEVSQQRSIPDILILHVGSNDLGNTNVSDLLCQMVKDLKWLHDNFPTMKIGYSFITPTSIRGTEKIDNDRIRINKTIQSSVELFNGFVIEHPRLIPFSHLFKSNGIHFTIEGFEMFVSSIYDRLEQILNSTFSGGQPQSTSVPHILPKVQVPTPEKETPSKEFVNGMSATVRQLEMETSLPKHKKCNLKRKHISESDSESYLPAPKIIRKICLKFTTENAQSPPEDEHWPNKKKPLLKRKRSSEEPPSPVKKIKLIYENVSEDELGFESPFASSPETVIQPEEMEEDTCSITSDSSPTTQTHHLIGAPDVWIVGSQYISNAKHAAVDESFGKSLHSNSNVKWIGSKHSAWKDIVKAVHQTISKESGPPEVLVIHTEGEELGTIPPAVIASQMAEDLRVLKEKYPQMNVALSLIIPRRHWRFGNPAHMNKLRTSVNKMIKEYTDLFDVVVEHENLVPAEQNIYLPDGVNLTKRGSQVFLNNIWTAIKTLLPEEQPDLITSFLDDFSERDFLNWVNQMITGD
uniref:Protein kinase domain-containing protein n=1 Tax=Oryzias latipes TaxID=8090 RepID=A0A3B3H4X1_ORYLA